MDLLEELKARDERIEKLERALLLVLSLNVGNHLDKSAKNCFSHVSSSAVEQMETLIAECGSTEKPSKTCSPPPKNASVSNSIY